MRKCALVCLVIGLFFAFNSMVMAAPGDGAPGNGIKQTYHDLSAGTGAKSTGWGDSVEQTAPGLDRVCIYCHAPHNTVMTGANYLPLWNHAVSTNVAAGFTMYTNGGGEPDMDTDHQSYAMANATEPGGVSILCLSCHDGSVGTNQYGTKSSGTLLTGRAVIGAGGDLSNHHPIGFNYNGARLSDDELADEATTDMGTTGYKIQDLLWNGQMECATCHDVHNTKNTGEKFLWTSDAQSALCLTCHLKNQ
jgi:predicted CXXCH cytochrome family protein